MTQRPRSAGPVRRTVARRALLLGSAALAAACASPDDTTTEDTPVPTPSPRDPITTTWRGEPGYRLQTPTMTLVALDRGGKIVSLVTGDDHEWLAQPVDGPLAPSGYGADFIGAEMCGWDECAPTVDATEVDGAALPDHGEVWSVDWTSTTAPGVLEQTVDGQALPYRFTRTITNDGQRFTIAYTVTNTGDEEIPFLWCGHPQFTADDDTRLTLDGSVEKVVVLGAPGEKPFLESAGSRPALADRKPHTTRKTWFRMGGDSAGVSLRHGDGPSLTMAWEPADIPYVAVWQDRARYAREPVVAPELSNGWYDNLARADANDLVLRLGPGEETAWSFTLASETSG